jgi:tetratricopeptide (TPR) repeat protein
MLPDMAVRSKSAKKGSSRDGSARSSSKHLKKKDLQDVHRGHAAHAPDPAAQAQLKLYEEALKLIQEQKFQKAVPALQKVFQGPNKELGDRARVHLRGVEQRLAKAPTATPPKGGEDHYTQGVAMMNLGRWDEAREHLDRALKAAPKADHIVYAMAALDCLTGEADSAMERLKFAIQLRPENRYHARNDEDFAFLQEDPRFTELLYPERDGSNG